MMSSAKLLKMALYLWTPLDRWDAEPGQGLCRRGSV